MKRKQHCGSCDACTRDNCEQCVNCKDMIKFGGTGKKSSVVCLGNVKTFIHIRVKTC